MDTMPARTTRILVVEDDADSADILSDLLQIWGFTARVARDGPAALIGCRNEAFDVVLLDLGLPFISGREVAKHIAARKKPGHAPYVTGQSAGHSDSPSTFGYRRYAPRSQWTRTNCWLSC